MLCLYLQAPFAAFRTFTAGSFRPTAEFITYSAAYGLLLNAAGIEMRQANDKGPMTLIRSGLPRFKLALGALSFPRMHSIFQQLHNYPVGQETGKKYRLEAKGNKYNIAPVRRSFLGDLRAYICMDRDADLEQKVVDGLQGRGKRTYGLLFAGDNNFLIDRLEPVAERREAHWFVPLSSDERGGMQEHVARLTIQIDRADMSRTQSQLFAPLPTPSVDVPETAWVEVGY